MKIKLSRASVVGHEKHGEVGETVEVSDRIGRELIQLGRGEEVTGNSDGGEAKKPAAKKTAAKKAAKEGDKDA